MLDQGGLLLFEEILKTKTVGINSKSYALFVFCCFPQLYNKYKVLGRIQLLLQNLNKRFPISLK